MVSKEMNQITACNAFCLYSVCISPDTLEAFLYINVDIIHKKISLFFTSLIQIIAGVIRTSATFNNNLESNANSFIYAVKQNCQAPPKNESDNGNSKTISIEGQVL